jgi:hypothetical protein
VINNRGAGASLSSLPVPTITKTESLAWIIRKFRASRVYAGPKGNLPTILILAENYVARFASF